VTQLARLARMCRGVGDPLAASYLRAYLACKGLTLCPPVGQHGAAARARNARAARAHAQSSPFPAPWTL